MIPSQTVYIPFDTPPLVEQAVPVYPDTAGKAGVEGIAMVVAVTIDETGKVIKAWVVHSGAVILNNAALSVWFRFHLDIEGGNW